MWKTFLMCLYWLDLFLIDFLSRTGHEDYWCVFKMLSGAQWADPGGTAIPGQPLTEPEQAPELYPLAKISLISKRGHAPRIRY